MGRKPIIVLLLAIILVVLVAVFLVVSRHASPAIVVRHVQSVRSGNVTTLTFEITNHSTAAYVFSPFKVQDRTGTVWSMDLNNVTLRQPQHLNPMGHASYKVEVTNLAAGSTLRFKINVLKELKGLNTFIKRAELKFRGTGINIPLNPFDKSSRFFALPEEVVSEEFVEPEQQ